MTHLKKMLLIIVCMMPMLASAAGTSYNGFVSVNGNNLQGSFSVKYSPAVSFGFIFITNAFVPQPVVTISAQDSTTAVYFSCAISATNTLYNYAVGVANGANSTTILRATRNPLVTYGNVPICTSLEAVHASSYQP